MKIRRVISYMLKNGLFSVLYGLLVLLLKNNQEERQIISLEILSLCSHIQIPYMNISSIMKRKIGLLGKRNSKQIGNQQTKNSTKLMSQPSIQLETDILSNLYLTMELKFYLLVTQVSVRLSQLRVFYSLQMLMFTISLLISQLVPHLRTLRRLLSVTLREEPRTSIDLRMPNKKLFALLMILICQERIPMDLNLPLN